MALQEREKKLLGAGAILAMLMVGYWAVTKDDAPPPLVKPVEVNNIGAAERRLKEVRQIAATVPSRNDVLRQATKELSAREKGLILGDTAAQAQAQLLQILRKAAKAPNVGIDLRNTEIGPVKTFGDRYGEATVSLYFEARIEQLVQLLSDLTAQSEIIGVNDIRIGTANPKEKTMPVRITVSGLVRRELAPERKAGSSL